MTRGKVEALSSRGGARIHMSIDACIRQSMEKLLQDLRTRLEAELPALVARVESETATTLQDAVHEAQAAAEQRAEGSLAAAREEAAATLASAVQAARTDASEMAARLAQAEERTAEVVAGARASERQHDLACMERLLSAVRDLDRASTLSEALNTLAVHISRQTGRAAILLVRGDRLRGFRVIGFGGGAPDPHTLDWSLEQAGVAGLAVRSGERVATSDAAQARGGGQQAGTLPFAPLPDDRVGLAVPILVGGRPVAVVYADDGAETEPMVPSAWPEAIEVIVRHAGRCLEILTTTKVTAIAATGEHVEGSKAPPSDDSPSRLPGNGAGDEEAARRYARLLVSEIKLYNEPVVAEGRREHDLLIRLRSEIERARRLYEERISPMVRAQGDFFGEELVRTLANGDPGLLGQVT